METEMGHISVAFESEQEDIGYTKRVYQIFSNGSAKKGLVSGSIIS